MHRIFVYGTLKPGHRNWRRLLQGQVRRWQAATIAGHLFELPDGIPAAIPGDGTIHGYLLQLPGNAELAAVNALEGFDPQGPAKRNTYTRRSVSCRTPQGAPLGQALAYFMTVEQVQRRGGAEITEGIWRPHPTRR